MKDERGVEVMGYVLVAGLTDAVAVAVIGSVGGKVLARRNTVDDGGP